MTKEDIESTLKWKAEDAREFRLKGFSDEMIVRAGCAVIGYLQCATEAGIITEVENEELFNKWYEATKIDDMKDVAK